jgi:hypothetical protein
MGVGIHRETVAEINDVRFGPQRAFFTALNALLARRRAAFTVARPTLNKVRTGSGHSTTEANVRANSERAGSFHAPAKICGTAQTIVFLQNLMRK